jgi:hypothetical protein
MKEKTMRLRDSLAIAMFGLGGCAHVPDHVRIELDGNSVEVNIKPKPAPPAYAPKG